MSATKQEGKKNYTIKRCIDVFLAAALAVSAVIGIKTVLKDLTDISRKNDDGNISVSSNDSKSENEFMAIPNLSQIVSIISITSLLFIKPPILNY